MSQEKMFLMSDNYGLELTETSSVKTVFRTSRKIWCHLVKNFMALSNIFGSSC